ncbi:MAG: fasciclin domain-containing protein [Phycisphaerales bacterium]|nr:fasciclin domain-containing protein [Phycisphaerales bacterium]
MRPLRFVATLGGITLAIGSAMFGAGTEPVARPITAEAAALDATVEARAPAPELPEYPRLTLLELDREAQCADSPFVGGGDPFVVLGVVKRQVNAGSSRLLLCQDAMACCSMHVTVCFGLDSEQIDPGAIEEGAWVAVFGRLRAVDAPKPGRRGVVASSFVATGHVIVPELVVPAERLVYPDNVVDLMASNSALTVFSRAVRESGLAEQLRVMGPITVLAPLDQGFERRSPTELEALFLPENREQLRSLVLQHVLRGRLTEADLSTVGSIATLSHRELDVDASNGTLRIGTARTVFENMFASNGVVHVINETLEPALALPPAGASVGESDDAVPVSRTSPAVGSTPRAAP